MKLLADENFPPSLVSYFQKKRHDIKRIQRSSRGVSDATVREKALLEKRIVISFDKDYLKSVDKPKKASVIVLDFPNTKPYGIIPHMDKIINAIVTLKRKKKSFVACYSKVGLEIIQ